MTATRADSTEHLLRLARALHDDMRHNVMYRVNWPAKARADWSRLDLALHYRVAALAVLVYPARIKRIKRPL